MKTIKVAISIPSEGHTLPEAYDNHLLLAFHLGAFEQKLKYENADVQYEFYWFTVGRLMTAFAREKLVEKALEGKMDFIVMFDDDMILPIDMVDAMLDDMEKKPEIGILGALAFMRNAPHYPVLFTTTEGYDQDTHQHYFINNNIKKYPKNTLIECDAVGFGAVCIRMDIVRKMQSPYFFSTTGSGEDIYFCTKARQEANARVFMDTRIKLGHLSNPKVIDEDYYDEYIEKNKIVIPDVPHKYLQMER